MHMHTNTYINTHASTYTLTYTHTLRERGGAEENTNELLDSVAVERCRSPWYQQKDGEGEREHLCCCGLC